MPPPIFSFSLLGNPILIKKGQQLHVCQKKGACRARPMPAQQKRHQTAHTNDLGVAEHEAEKPTFCALINLVLFWVFDPVSWKIGWRGEGGAETKGKKPQAVTEKNAEAPPREETGRQDELLSCIVPSGKKLGEVIPNQRKRVCFKSSSKRVPEGR